MIHSIVKFVGQKLKEGYWDVTRAIGLEWVHGKGLADIGREIHRFVLRVALPFVRHQRRRFVLWCYAPLAWALRRANVHFINPHCLQLERIGHLALDLDSYLKDRMLAGVPFRPVLLACDCKPNAALFAKWKDYYSVVTSPVLIRLIDPLLNFPGLATKMREYGMVGWEAWDPSFPFKDRRGASPIFEIQRRWVNEGRSPLLQLRPDEIERGRQELRALGLPDGAWFVCVHAREGGYSPTDEWSHSYRNAQIADYRDAMASIVNRGGWCVRMGDPTMRPLEPMKGVIDYALSPSKSDWMDIFLCSQCRFFLGTSSGLVCVSGIFGRPNAVANMAPLAGCYSMFPGDICIPKRLMNVEGRVLSWHEIFATEACELRLSPEYAQHGVKLIDNTPSEIAALATEMMNRLDGAEVDDPDDEKLQEAFKSLVQPEHFCWGAATRIGKAFLREHRALLNC